MGTAYPTLNELMNPWGEVRRRAESFSGLREILKIFCAKENAESEDKPFDRRGGRGALSRCGRARR